MPLVLVVLWSSGFVGAELGTREAPTATLLAWRYLVAALVLVAVCLWRRDRVTRDAVRRQAVLGLLLHVAYMQLTVGGIALGASAGTTSLIASLQPLVVVALAAVVLRERASGRRVLGLALGLLGVALVVCGDLSVGGTSVWVFAMPLAGTVAISAGAVLQQRWDPPEGVLVSLTVQTVVAAAVFLVVALVQDRAAPPTTTGFWTAVAWVVVLAGFGGYGSFLHVVRTQGAARASTWLYLTPPTVMLWAAWMFGDRVTPVAVAGLVVCAAGVGAALSPPGSWRGARCRRSRRRSRTAAP